MISRRCRLRAFGPQPAGLGLGRGTAGLRVGGTWDVGAGVGAGVCIAERRRRKCRRRGLGLPCVRLGVS